MARNFVPDYVLDGLIDLVRQNHGIFISITHIYVYVYNKSKLLAQVPSSGTCLFTHMGLN